VDIRYSLLTTSRFAGGRGLKHLAGFATHSCREIGLRGGIGRCRRWDRHISSQVANGLRRPRPRAAAGPTRILTMNGNNLAERLLWDMGHKRKMDISATDAAKNGVHTGSTILVVDDEGTSRAMLGHMLHACLGCKIVSFGNPLEALRWCQDNHFDVAVLDYRMPTMDGLTLARQLNEICPACRIVLVSAYEISQLPDDARAREVAVCLPKSRGIDAIVEQVRVLL